jgi:carboxylate-amine ligase
MVRQNKWRACRYGMEAKLVNPTTFQAAPARQIVHSLIDRLAERAHELDCIGYLRDLHDLAELPTGAELQMQTFQETQEPAEVVRRGLALTEPSFTPR